MKININFETVQFQPKIKSKEIAPNMPNFENSEIARLARPNDSEREISLESIGNCLNVY